MRLATRFVRRASLVGLLAWLGLLVGLFAHRQLTTPTITDHGGGNGTALAGGERPIRVQKGVVYQSTVGAEPSFRVAADEAAEYESGWADLSNVQLSLYSQGIVTYGLVASQARFNAAQHLAHTIGESILSLQGGVAVRSSGFQVRGVDRILESQGAVTFAGPGWGGVADKATVLLADDVLELEGNVTMSRGSPAAPGGSPVVAMAPNVQYFRKQAVVMLNDGATLLAGPMRATTPRIAVLLTGAEGDVHRVIMAPPVKLEGRLPSGEPVDVEAGDTVMDFLPEGRMRLNSSPLPVPGWITLRWADPVMGWRELRTARLFGEGSATAWEWLEGQVQSCALELAPGAEPRMAEARRARFEFSDGSPSMLTASEDVVLSTGPYRASGGELKYSLRSEVFTLRPQPDGRVRVEGPDLEAFCDRIEGSQDRTLRATGQVTGTVRQRGTVPGSEEPISFAAETAQVPPGAERLLLEGDARLWQTHRLVRADQIELERATEAILGRGSVLTTARTPAGSGAAEVVVKARQVRYDQGAGQALYEGDVSLTDPQGQVSCQRLLVLLDGAGSVRQVDMEGGVSITQVQTGRLLTGQKGRLDVAADVFEVWGTPVLVREKDGNQIKSDRLEWRRQTNTVVVIGGEESPSESLYRVQPTPGPGPGPTPRAGRRPS